MVNQVRRRLDPVLVRCTSQRYVQKIAIVGSCYFGIADTFDDALAKAIKNAPAWVSVNDDAERKKLVMYQIKLRHIDFRSIAVVSPGELDAPKNVTLTKVGLVTRSIIRKVTKK